MNKAESYNSSEDKKLNNFKPKFFWFERLPNGEKVLCIAKRSRGEKHEIKLTFEQLTEEFKKA